MKGWHFGDPSVNEKVQTGIAMRPHQESETANILSHDPSNSTIMTIDTIHQNAARRSYYMHRQIHNRRTLQELKQSRKSIQIGFACVILKYFQAIDILQVERERWSISNHDNDFNIMDEAGKKKEVKYSTERLKMMQEDLNARHRQRLLTFANEKAKRGSDRLIRKKYRSETEKVTFILFDNFLKRICLDRDILMITSYFATLYIRFA